MLSLSKTVAWPPVGSHTPVLDLCFYGGVAPLRVMFLAFFQPSSKWNSVTRNSSMSSGNVHSIHGISNYLSHQCWNISSNITILWFGTFQTTLGTRASKKGFSIFIFLSSFIFFWGSGTQGTWLPAKSEQPCATIPPCGGANFKTRLQKEWTFVWEAGDAGHGQDRPQLAAISEGNKAN